MAALEKIQKNLADTGAFLASLVKIALKSKPLIGKPAGDGGEECVILGNGPSLTKTVEENRLRMMSMARFAVNFMANAPLFFELQPQYYVLADPHFFKSRNTDPKVNALWDNISKVDWPLTLYIPSGVRRDSLGEIGRNSNITLKSFNMTPIEGYRWFRHLCYKSGLGMPRPRNVLIPTIMLAMREGFRKIYLAGADHSWTKSIWVDDDNYVVSVQPHFYPDDEKELQRVRQEYKGVHLHHIFNSFAVALRSYFDIKDYADSRGVKIINITPGSFIDAFPRQKSL